MIRPLTSLAVCAGLLLSLFPAPTHAGDWPQWRGPDRTGICTEAGLRDRWESAPAVVWKADGLGIGWSSAAISNGKVYITGMRAGQGMLFCFDEKTGARQWMASYGAEWADRTHYPGARGTPTVHDGRVFVLSGTGGLACFDAASGKRRWAINVLSRFGGRNIRWGLSESLLIEGKTLIVTPGGPDASVVALSYKTGKTVWKSAGLSDRSAYCSPLAITHGGTRMLVTMIESRVVGLEAATGKTLWSEAYNNMFSVHAITPVYRDGSLYCTSGYGKGGMLLKLGADGRSATVAWKSKVLDCHHGGVVAIGDRIYGTGSSRPRNRLAALSFTKGEVLFSDRAIGKGAVIAVGTQLLCSDERGQVTLVQPGDAGFEVRGRFKVDYGTGEHGWSHPAIANGRLYLRRGNEMRVYDISGK